MLEEKLRELAQSNRYPFHMPGHKRMLDGTNPYAIDITEIEDFDNLHHAEGIIKDAEDAAAKMYGAKKAAAEHNNFLKFILSSFFINNDVIEY